ncbi:MAG TPA: M23 family metallopeptidase, partial [Bradyrhizobium sp.]
KEQAAEPTHSVSLVAPTSETPHAKDSVKTAEGAGSLPTFRWPAQGRIIAGFGSSPNGGQNDGINLAVPEGTPVKAAEDGVVAYSGNELKGYGNLVLVRHSNGYVTAYAHASELLVKRGDTIKRGQIIAKSGQSGEVGSPQLHFEIRKGSSPVDPLQFLNGA